MTWTLELCYNNFNLRNQNMYLDDYYTSFFIHYGWPLPHLFRCLERV